MQSNTSGFLMEKINRIYGITSFCSRLRSRRESSFKNSRARYIRLSRFQSTCITRTRMYVCTLIFNSIQLSTTLLDSNTKILLNYGLFRASSLLNARDTACASSVFAFSSRQKLNTSYSRGLVSDDIFITRNLLTFSSIFFWKLIRNTQAEAIK